MRLSLESGANFQREGQGKPSQKGSAKPGQDREGLLGPRGGCAILVWRVAGVDPPFKDGSPYQPGSDSLPLQNRCGCPLLALLEHPIGAYSYEDSPLLPPPERFWSTRAPFWVDQNVVLVVQKVVLVDQNDILVRSSSH